MNTSTRLNDVGISLEKVEAIEGERLQKPPSEDLVSRLSLKDGPETLEGWRRSASTTYSAERVAAILSEQNEKS